VCHLPDNVAAAAQNRYTGCICCSGCVSCLMVLSPSFCAVCSTCCTCCCLVHISIIMLTRTALHTPAQGRDQSLRVFAQCADTALRITDQSCSPARCCLFRPAVFSPQGRCRGKRVGVFGAFLLAIYNEETEEYQTISKIGTGFSEEQLKELADLLRPFTISDPRTYYRSVTISQPRS